MNKNYTITHCHTYYSLCDSTTSFKSYVDKAVEEGMTAITFTEHGNIFKWVDKKNYCDKKGIKYIHGMEAYLTQGLKFGKLKDNYHIILLAKNQEGIKEINRLFSKSFEPDHFYYKPRITFDEFMALSDNVITTSACLGGPLWKIIKTIDYLKNQVEIAKTTLSEVNTNRNKAIVAKNPSKKKIESLDKSIDTLNKKIKNFEDNITYLKEMYIPILRKFDFLEIQPHVMLEEQKQLNKMLCKYAKKYNLKLIAGTDTHSLNKYQAECRMLLIEDKQKNRKKKETSDEGDFQAYEEECDLTFKTYSELVKMFEEQHAVPASVYLEAIENTNRVANMVESFELDTSYKYNDIEGVEDTHTALKQRINERFFDKKKHSVLIKDKYKEYLYNLREEYRVFDKIGMTGFMLYMSDLISWCKENNILNSPCRGSVGGSTTAYITDIIDVDPVFWHTIFSRFANESRVELGDIDIDVAPDQRDLVYEHIINSYPDKQTAFILTFGTQKALGTIDSLGRTYNIPLEEVKQIKNEFKSNYAAIKNEFPDLFEDEKEAIGFGSNPEIEYIKRLGEKKHYPEDDIERVIKSHLKRTENLRTKYPNLVKYYNGLFGCPVSQSMHPAGIVVAPSYVDLFADYGVFKQDGKKILAIDMDECHDISLVKYDILGLKQLQIDRITCELADIKPPRAADIDWNDDVVWTHMYDNPIGIFQYEGTYAFKLLKEFNARSIDDMTLINAALRPSGKSYRDNLLKRIPNKNPSKMIDDLLKSSLGYLVYQEQIIAFLQEICGLSGSEADNIRRGIAHKKTDMLEKAMPTILEGYCSRSDKPREVAEKEAKKFMDVIWDASSYMFGYNHATGYSMEGYRGIYLRTYFPAEFIAGYLNSAKNIDDIKNGDSLAKTLNIAYLNDAEVRKRKVEIINKLSDRNITVDDLPQYPSKIKMFPPTFGKSRGNYTVDHETYSIYKGIGSVKTLNKSIAEELYDLAQNDKYKNIDALDEKERLSLFAELLFDIQSNTSLNKTHLETLIKINFFKAFGGNKTLMRIYENIRNITTRKQYYKTEFDMVDVNPEIFVKYVGKTTEALYKDIDFLGYYKEWTTTLTNESFPLKEQLEMELDLIGSFITKVDSDTPYYVVNSIKTYNNPNLPYTYLEDINTGEVVYGKVKNESCYSLNKYREGDIITDLVISQTPKFKKDENGKRVKTNEMMNVFESWKKI